MSHHPSLEPYGGFVRQRTVNYIFDNFRKAIENDLKDELILKIAGTPVTDIANLKDYPRLDYKSEYHINVLVLLHKLGLRGRGPDHV